MKRLAATAVLAAAVLAGCTPVWVAPTGLDSNPGTEAAPKRTLQAACAVGSDGQRQITMKAGVYPEQTVPAGCSNTTIGEQGDAIVRATSPSDSVPALALNAPDVQVSGIEVDSNALERKSAHISADRVKLQGVKLGHVVNDKPLEVFGSDVEIRDSVIGDADVQPLPGCDDVTIPCPHLECLFLVQAERVQVVGNTFHHCGVYDIAITRCTWCSNPPPPIWGQGRLEGNTFFHSEQAEPGSWHYNEVELYGVQYGTAGWTVKNNAFETRSPGNPGQGGIGWDQWSGGTRCGNTEFGATGVLDAVWKVAC